MRVTNKNNTTMKTFKKIAIAVTMFITMFIICAIDGIESVGGTALAMVVAGVFGTICAVLMGTEPCEDID